MRDFGWTEVDRGEWVRGCGESTLSVAAAAADGFVWIRTVYRSGVVTVTHVGKRDTIGRAMTDADRADA